MQVLDAAATADLLDAARSHTLFVPILLAGLCGLRRGEICALRWRSVDLEAGQLSINASTEQTIAGGIREKETKSGRARVVALPAMVIVELRRYRIEQVQLFSRLGINLTEDQHVVTQADGSRPQPSTISHSFGDFVREHGLKRIRFHDLRHSHATHMLAGGIHPKIASERLGHSKIGITLDLYSHVLPGMQDEAAAQVNMMISGALDRRRDPGE